MQQQSQDFNPCGLCDMIIMLLPLFNIKSSRIIIEWVLFRKQRDQFPSLKKMMIKLVKVELNFQSFNIKKTSDLLPLDFRCCDGISIASYLPFINIGWMPVEMLSRNESNSWLH